MVGSKFGLMPAKKDEFLGAVRGLGLWVYTSEQIDERHFARAIYIQFPKKHDPIFYSVSVSNNGYISLDRLWSHVTVDHASET